MKTYDIIGVFGQEITAVNLSQMLKDAGGDDITFNVATLGGSIWDGKAMHNLVKAYKGNTTANIIGDTASAGTIFALGCDRVVQDFSVNFLVHNSSDMEGGNASELRRKAEELEKEDAVMVAIYHQKTGLAPEKIRGLMAKEDWIDPQTAKKYGFVDEISDTGMRVAAYVGGTDLSNELLNKLHKSKSKSKNMNFFGKKEDKKEAKVTNHLLTLKDGGHIICSAETPEVSAEVAPVGVAQIEDGTYMLDNGMKIVVEGGVITEVLEPEQVEGKKDEDEIYGAVAKILNDFEAKINRKIEALKRTGTQGSVPRSNSGIAPKVDTSKKSIQAKIQEKQAQIRASIKADRDK